VTDFSRLQHAGVDFWASSSFSAPEEENPMAEPWASVDDLAKHLGVAKDSIYRWIERRSLPAHRIGRLWKFKISEVDDWVRAGGTDADPGAASKK